MAITVIIITHNSAEVIKASISPIYGHEQISKYIIVDNASTDNTLEIIESSFPEVEIIRNAENKGFGVACNQALEQVNTEFVLFLNPDAVIDKKCIDRLLNSFSSYPDAAIVAPVLENNNSDDLSSQSVKLPVIHSKKQKKLNLTNDKDIYSVYFISGAVAMWKMEHMRKVGFYDPAFFLFCEDDDISIRTHKAGYKMLLDTSLVAKHNPGKSCKTSKRLERLKLRASVWSQLYINRKYNGVIHSKIRALSLIFNSIKKFFEYRKDIKEAAKDSKFVKYYGEDKLWIEAQQKESELWELSRKIDEELWSYAQQQENELWETKHKLEDKLWSSLERVEEELWIRSSKNKDDIWSAVQSLKQDLWLNIHKNKEEKLQEAQKKKEKLLLGAQRKREEFSSFTQNKRDRFLSLVRRRWEANIILRNAWGFIKDSKNFRKE